MLISCLCFVESLNNMKLTECTVAITQFENSPLVENIPNTSVGGKKQEYESCTLYVYTCKYDYPEQILVDSNNDNFFRNNTNYQKTDEKTGEKGVCVTPANNSICYITDCYYKQK